MDTHSRHAAFAPVHTRILENNLTSRPLRLILFSNLEGLEAVGGLTMHHRTQRLTNVSK